MTWLASSRVGTRTRPRGWRGLGLADAAEEREPEGEGLARAGLGLAADVAPGEGVGDGERLDGEGLGDALARQGRDEVGVEAEAREGCGHGEVARFRRVVCEVTATSTGLRMAVGRTSGCDHRCDDARTSDEELTRERKSGARRYQATLAPDRAVLRDP